MFLFLDVHITNTKNLTKMPRKTPPYRTLIFKKNYKTYEKFYEENKVEIYKTILDVFKGFQGNKNSNLTFHLGAVIKDCKWESDFIFNRKETHVLIEDLIPYFEMLEDYEICGEIGRAHV